MPDIYIHNRTCLPMSFALSQIGPLYMENNVPPGQFMKRHVGSVHFTIQAKVYNGTKASEFSPNDNILPILGIGFATLTIGGGALAAAAAGSTFLATVTSATVCGLGTTISLPAWAATAIAVGLL